MGMYSRTRQVLDKFRTRHVAESIPHPTSESERVITAPSLAYWPIFLSFSFSAMSRREPNNASGDGEREPLLANSPSAPRKKSWYSARPLWLVQFAIMAACIRGMTLSSRVEVFTQVSCTSLERRSFVPTSSSPDAPFYYDAPQPSWISFLSPLDNAALNHTDPNERARQCKSNAAVQSGAARIQTLFSITSGLLSALTTGWWGHMGERFGRTKILAIATFGWFLSDSFFILASAPASPFASQRVTMVLLAPIFEGILGGWSTIQSGATAYISDCTGSGSRAAIFSFFTGMFFLGFSIGPLIGGWVISHPFGLFSGAGGLGSVTSVFWVAALCSFTNFCLVLFIIPESVTKEQRDRASARMVDARGAALRDPRKLGFIREFFSPLEVFLPVSISTAGSSHKRRDWSLTLVTFTLFSYMFSQGLYQVKYLYGTHVYGWDPVELSYYISFMGGGRAVFLLFALPFVIARFKPKSSLPKPQSAPGVPATKPQPTKAHLKREMKFDINLTRVSLCIELAANALVVIAPAPTLHDNVLALTSSADSQFRTSQALFVVASSISSWGTGLIPSTQSLALCILQARALLDADSASSDAAPAEVNTGKLFGAIALLQAAGQMILGPLFFGLIYSGTVATYPKAVFVAVNSVLFAAFIAMVVVRNPLSGFNPTPAEDEEERGRPRGSKPLRLEAGSSLEPEQGSSSSGSD
ncbi:major facilitator superfamily-domain-containing protein [Mycena sanguinolenta]|nr:major facilitator superfamily-domain-containing protein [Mycena sanguinolenta]